MNPDGVSHLSRISTQIEDLKEARDGSPPAWERLYLRYQKAVRKFLLKLLRDEDAADQVADDVLFEMRKGFPKYEAPRGRFRDYLRQALRFACLNWWREQRRHGHVPLLFDPPAEDRPFTAEEDEGLRDALRDKILEHALQTLRNYETRKPGNVSATLIGLLMDLNAADTAGVEGGAGLAERLLQETGRRFEPAALRQQIHRARKRFAACVRREVKRTVAAPTRAAVREELVELGLWIYVRDYLPE